ncbi:peptide ABC transporter substrate-binding protein [Lactobacillus nasalidis]|uniref:Peptide ABC transporter substrate-binding protein n=1 Tax=Lactobacillus nasalidis TaxID=2797258 RepID=A0ABQ3W6Q3_9LACO|nr:peptide ABC transporter substrate-binding protein [Lactobacillus nasalidis]
MGGLAVLTSTLLAACGNSSSSKTAASQKLNWMEEAELSTIDVSKILDDTSFNQVNQVMEGLYTLGNNAKVKNALATKTTVSKDGKTWTFNIRKNAKWSNGQQVTAKDFVFSWRRTVNPKTASEYSYLFSGIKNADSIVAGKKSPSTLGVKADGKYKLVVTLDRKIPYFKLLMAFPLFFPQNEQAVKKYGSKYGTASKYMVYNGPFIHKGWTGSNLSWKLVKNKYYWDKKNVKLTQINYSVQKSPSTAYNLYQDGKLDGAILDSQASKQLAKSSGYTVRKLASTEYLQFNMKKYSKFKNTDLRRGISMAINRNSLSKTLGATYTAATTFTSSGLTTVNGKDFTKLTQSSESKKYTSYNKQLAKQYFEKGLKAVGLSKLSFTILSTDDDTSKKLAEFVQSELETAFGSKISVKVQSIPSKTKLNRVLAGNFECTLSGWIADYADPISFLDCETTGNSYNYGGWSNKEYDKLIAASKTSSGTARMKILAQAENVLMVNQGVTPLTQSSKAWMIKSKVKGIIYNSAGVCYNFKYAYIAK